MLLRWNPQLLSFCGGHQYKEITKIIVNNLIKPMLLLYPDAVRDSTWCDDCTTVVQRWYNGSGDGRLMPSFCFSFPSTFFPLSSFLTGLVQFHDHVPTIGRHKQSTVASFEATSDAIAQRKSHANVQCCYSMHIVATV